MSKKRLGRGLDALLSSSASRAPVSIPGEAGTNDTAQNTAASDSADSKPADGLRELSVDQLYRGRYQPRREFDEAALEELAASIKQQGLMQPVVVRPREAGGFEIIAGERRWRACQIAGLSQIPVLVRDVSDEDVIAMALIENIQREDLSPLEEARALARLRDEFQLTQQEVADAVGKSRVAVANLLRLLNVAPGVQALLEAGELEMGHARALLSLETIDQERLGREIARKKLSVRQAEALVRKLSRPTGNTAKPATSKDADTRRLEIELSESIGAPVRIDNDPQGKGQLVIGYANMDQLDAILSHLRRRQ
ncbi:MAG: ParB/RepB/Spo0J family partition protein [Pseudomonadaceae bacterium]|nr:ParB/RepB/Spo0J family partition protein [Pseudomonadaceae bacterium]